MRRVFCAQGERQARRMPFSSMVIMRFLQSAPVACLKVRLLTPSSSLISAAEL